MRYHGTILEYLAHEGNVMSIIDTLSNILKSRDGLEVTLASTVFSPFLALHKRYWKPYSCLRCIPDIPCQLSFPCRHHRSIFFVSEVQYRSEERRHIGIDLSDDVQVLHGDSGIKACTRNCLS